MLDAYERQYLSNLQFCESWGGLRVLEDVVSRVGIGKVDLDLSDLMDIDLIEIVLVSASIVPA